MDKVPAPFKHKKSKYPPGDLRPLLNALGGRYSPDPYVTDPQELLEFKRVEMPDDERASIDPDGAVDGTVEVRELDQ